MSQATTWGVPRTGPVAPDDYATRDDESHDASLSNHSGASRPSYAVVGTIWLDTSVSGVNSFYEYDGSTDRLLFSVDTATGEVTFNGTRSLHKRTVITASDASWEYDAETKLAIVEIVGGGGGGGGANPDNNGSPLVAHSSGGGAAGAYCKKMVDVSALSPKEASITIGAGGAAGSGTSGATLGGTGGTSTYDDGTTLLTAVGGGGGGSFTATSLISGGLGASGGAASGGDINVKGSPGDPPFYAGGTATTGSAYAKGGTGGSGPFGAGGEAIASRASSTSGANGNAASGYGAGGGGAVRINSIVGQVGGAGTAGVCIIWEYK